MDHLLPLINLPTAYLVSAAVVAITVYLWPIWRSSRYPPGPIPLPIIGHLHHLLFERNPLRFFSEKFGGRYGDMFTVWFGQTPTVFLNSFEAIHEGFVKKADHLSDRPVGGARHNTGAEGLVDAADGKWQPLRRMILSVFKEHGVGKVGMETQIIEECSFYLEALNKKVGESFNPKDQLVQSISNIITRVIFGNRFDYGSEHLENVQFDRYLGIEVPTRSLPILRHIPGDPFKLGYHEKRAQFLAGLEFTRSQIKSHKETLDEDNPRDFIDSFLIEIKKHESDPDTPFTEPDLLSTTMQQFVAGSDTTSTSLNWSFLYMILHPAIQRKVHEEIDSVIGGKPPQYSDRNSMPYTQAVLSEVLRTSIAPASVNHKASKDVIVNGQTIPEGTTVVALLWSMHYDKTLYPEPHEFNPDHFLDAEGNYIKPDKSFMPFSIGRRYCPGEALARTELFLFFVSTIQKFEICGVPGVTYTKEGRQVFTYSPLPYQLILKRRL